MLFLTISQLSCKKADLLESVTVKNQAGIRKFFPDNPNVSPQVKRVMAEMEEQNQSVNNGLVKNILHDHGSPVWEKSLVYINGPKLMAQLRTVAGSDHDTLVIVPLVKENDDQVQAYIEGRLNGEDVSLQIRRAGTYSKLPFGDARNKIQNAEIAAVRFMILTENVFGIRQFKITDKKLFSGFLQEGDTSQFIKVALRPAGDAASRVRLVELCLDIQVTTMSGWHCGTPDYPKCKDADGCDHCGTYCVPTYTTNITSYCATWWEDDGGGGTEDGGSGTSGEGSGGGGYPPGGNENPCDDGGIIVNGKVAPSPCDLEEIPGWIPVVEDEGFNFITALDLSYAQTLWLTNNTARGSEIHRYLEGDFTVRKKEIALQHLERMMTDAAYLKFVEGHAASGNAQIMWWEDEEWLNPYGGLDFGSWAIGYLQSNPDTSFDFFRNQYMAKTAEGSDGGDEFDINDYDNVQVPTFPNLPGRNAFYAAFPKEGTVGMNSASVYELVGGNMFTQNIGFNRNYQNACAIRVSRALNYSGQPIPIFKNDEGKQRSEKGDDGKNYILDAASLLAYMLKAYPNNPPLHLKNKTVQEYQNELNGKWGIYIMIPRSATEFEASGHADFFSKTGCLTKSCYFAAAKEIYFWELL